MKASKNKSPAVDTPGAQHLLESAIHEALTLAARLASFANALHYSWMVKSDVETIQERQLTMYFQDIVAFALHVRRIGELTGLRRGTDSLRLVDQIQPAPKPIRGRKLAQEEGFWQVINKVIHSRSIILVSRDEAEEAPGFETYDCISDFRGRRFRECLVRSDQGGEFSLSIERLVITFAEIVLPRVRIGRPGFAGPRKR